MVFLEGLRIELRQRCLLTVADARIPAPLVRRLAKEFQAIQDLLSLTVSKCSAEHDEGHQLARDCFAKLHALCRTVDTILPGSPHADLGRRPDVGSSDPVLATRRYFRDLGDTAMELKRFHYTRAAHFALDAYARTEVDNQAAVVPGLIKGRTGSELTVTREIGVRVKASMPWLFHNLGPMGGLKWSSEERDLLDDDKDSVTFCTGKLTIMGGIAFKIGKLFDKNGAHRIANFFASMRYSRTGGSYHDFKDPLSAVKAKVQRNANKWEWVFRSGDPNALTNRLHQHTMRWNGYVMKHMFGVIYLPTPCTPNVNQRKLEKGAFNTAKIIELAGRLDSALPLSSHTGQSDSIAALVRKAYGAADTLEVDDHQGAAWEYSKDGVVAPSVFSPLVKISPLPTPGNGEPSASGRSIKRHTVGCDAGASGTVMDLVQHQPGQVRTTGSANASLEFGDNVMNFMRLKPPHEQMDPAYSKNIVESRRIMHELETTYFGEPKLHTYNQTKQLLGRNVGRWQSNPQCRTAQQLDNADEAMALIKARYRKLMYLAGVMHSLRDKKYRDSMPEKKRAEHDGQFAAFMEELFGINSRSSWEAQRFARKLKSDPAVFMGQSYDALSIAAGQVGIQIFDIKKNAQETCDRNDPRKAQLWEGRQRTDMNYDALKKLMAGVFMPIGEEALYRSCSIHSRGRSWNRTSILTLDGLAGFFTSPLQYIRGNYPEPASTSASALGNPVLGTLSSMTAAAGVSVAGVIRDVKQHPNPLRAGMYRVLKFSMRGEGLFAPLMDKAVRAGLKAIGAHQALHDVDELLKADTNFLKGARQTLAQAIFAEGIKESEINVAWRTPQEVEKNRYESSVQYVRVISRSTHLVNPVIGVPLHHAGVPMTVSISAGQSQVASHVVLEVMGACPAYHMLQFSEIRTLLNEGVHADAQARHRARGQADKSVDLRSLDQAGRGLDTHCDMSRIRRLLGLETPVETSLKVDADYLRNKYFGTSETILGFMDKFMHYSATRRAIGGPAATFEGPRNEFHRLEDNNAYFNTMTTMRIAEKYAPGKLANTRIEDGQTLAEYEESDVTDARPTIADMRRLERAIAQTREALGNSDLTPRERACYFLADAADSPGRVVFDAYIKILNGYEEIHNGLKSNNTYRSVVVRHRV